MPDVATFDGESRIMQITVPPVAGALTIDAYDLYSSWVRWMRSDTDNQKWYEAFSQEGGSIIGPGKTTGVRVFVMNGWLIRPFDAPHRLTLENFIAGDNDAPIITPTLGGYAVAVTYSIPADAIGIDTSGVPAPTVPEIVQGVWNAPENGGWLTGSIGRAILTIAKFLALK